MGGQISRFKHARLRTVVLHEKLYAILTVQVLTCNYGDVQLQHEDLDFKNKSIVFNRDIGGVFLRQTNFFLELSVFLCLVSTVP